MRTGPPPPVTRPERVGLLCLFFASGATALVYQVLWVREVGLLVGSTAQAAAITIAVFLAEIATGGWWWGQPRGRPAPWSPSAASWVIDVHEKRPRPPCHLHTSHHVDDVVLRARRLAATAP